MVKRLRSALALLALACLALGIFAGLRPGSELVFASEVRLAMPPEAAWRKLRDLSLAHHFVPGIQRTEITSRASHGIGASRRVYTSATDYLVEAVAEWREGRGFTLAVTDASGRAPLPFSQTRFSYEIQDAGDGTTRLRTRLAGTLPGGRLGEWLGKTLLAAPLQARVDAIGWGLRASPSSCFKTDINEDTAIGFW